MAEDWFPIFDGHIHFSQAYLDQVLESWALYGVTGGIDLWFNSGSWYGDYGLDFAEMLTMLKERKATRFVQFYWPNWREFGWRPRQCVVRLCADMRRYDALGARGLKVWKDLGMSIIHPDGKPATMDEPALEPVWKTAAELHWTIAIHQADPTPKTGSFEARTRTGFSREELFERRDRVIAAHPEIRFILCHNCNDIESVARWAEVFERFPNCMSDVGRDPLAYDKLADVQAFFEKYAERILMGSDMGMPDHRPPDDPWTLENIYRPWRQRIRSWNLSPRAFELITTGNGEREFL